MSKLTIRFALTFFIVMLGVSGCADWNSQPDTVDRHFGESVRHMIKAQTLNPQPGYADMPVIGLDGQKSEGNIKRYRSGNTDLRAGKEHVEFDVDN